MGNDVLPAILLKTNIVIFFNCYFKFNVRAHLAHVHDHAQFLQQ